MRPRFSIVIPTRNRASLLRLCLLSAIHQQFDDYEIVVSDDHSTDETRNVVGDLDNKHLRYVQPPHRSSMPDHFEWALSHANGDFVTFLCDDDAISPDFLPRIDAILKDTQAPVIALTSAVYYHPDVSQGSKVNHLVATRYSGKIAWCDSGVVLRAIFGRLQWGGTPRSNNSFCHRDVISKIKRRFGRFFLAPAADMSSCSLVLATVPGYMLVDEPLHIFGVSEQSIGNDQQEKRGPSSVDFCQAFDSELFRLSPLKIYSVSNILAESLLRVSELQPGQFPDIHPAELYLACRRDLERLRSNGVDVSRDWAQLEVFRKARGIKSKVGWWLLMTRNAVSVSPLGRFLRRVKHTFCRPPVPLDPDSEQVCIDGEVAGFSNIYECAQSLPRLRDRLVRNL